MSLFYDDDFTALDLLPMEGRDVCTIMASILDLPPKVPSLGISGFLASP